MSPFFVAILAYFTMNQKMTTLEVFFMVGSYVGVLLIALSGPADSEEVSPKSYKLACFVLVFVSFGLASVTILTRKLKLMHVSVIQFNYALFCTIIQSFLFLPSIHSKRPSFKYVNPT